MDRNIILLAETGSDITAEIAEKYKVELVPMHVTFGKETKKDGSFDPEEIYRYYERTGELPKTSAAMPQDFTEAFDAIHEKYPKAHILHLAYSAATTGSYQNALLAARGRDYVTSLDTRQVTIGQAAVVVEVAKILERQPDIGVDELVKRAEAVIDRAAMCFLPDDLEYLRAGGRVSNVAYLGARILSLHPCIELLDGKLVATKKYRGRLVKLAEKLVTDYAEKYDLDRECLWMVYTARLSDKVRQSAEQAAEKCGFAKVKWLPANGVITTHGGPGAFGLAGLRRE